MATSEERMKILKMIQEGKLTAEEAAQLMEALEDRRSPASNADSQPESMPQSGGKTPKWFRVRVTDTKTGRPRVNVRLPVNLVTAGLKMGARFAPEVEGLNPEHLMELITAGEVGQVVDVYDPQDGEHVEVFLE